MSAGVYFNTIVFFLVSHHLTKTIEVTRVNLFNIVTQYRAIFNDDEHSPLALIKNHNVNQNVIFFSWIKDKVLSSLKFPLVQICKCSFADCWIFVNFGRRLKERNFHRNNSRAVHVLWPFVQQSGLRFQVTDDTDFYHEDISKFFWCSIGGFKKFWNQYWTIYFDQQEPSECPMENKKWGSFAASG